MTSETIALVVNGAIALFTLGYVIFTYRLMKATVAAAAETKGANRRTLEQGVERLRLHVLPHVFLQLEWRIMRDSQTSAGTYLVVANAGSEPCLAADLIVVMTYCLEEDDFEKWRRRYLREGYQDGEDVLRIPEQWFEQCLIPASQRMSFDIVPGRKQMVTPLPAEPAILGVDVWMQFDDVLDNTYAFSDYFHVSEEPPHFQRVRRQSQGSPKPVERIIVPDALTEVPLPSGASQMYKSMIPGMDVGMLRAYRNSFPLEYVNGVHWIWENYGQMEDIYL